MNAKLVAPSSKRVDFASPAEDQNPNSNGAKATLKKSATFKDKVPSKQGKLSAIKRRMANGTPSPA